MLDFLTQFQDSLRFVNGEYLLIAGIVMLVLALPLWLAGVHFARMAAFLTIAAVGAGIFWYAQPALIPFAIALVVCLGLGTCFYKKALLLLLCLLLSSSYAVLKVPYEFQSQSEGIFAGPAQGETLTLQEFANNLHSFAEVFVTNAQEFAKSLPMDILIHCSLIALGVLIVGFFLQKLTISMVLSFFGTVFSFTALFFILLYKPASPINLVSSNPQPYQLVFAGMIIFGFFSQLLFCAGPGKRLPQPEIEDNEGDE